MPSVEEVEEAAIDLETDVLDTTINETLAVQPMQDTGQPGRAKPDTPEEGRRGSEILQPSTPSQSLRAKRKLKREAAEQRTLAAWDDEFIAKAQEKCPEVGPIRSWLIENVKPDWSNVRGESPATKAYYQQYTSLYVRGNVLYRRLEKEEAKSEPTSQLVIPKSLRNEFLKATHEGVAGHLGSLKTRAHVGRRAYWFKWRRDVDIFCGKCDMCCEYKRGRKPPKQGKLMPMTMGSPLERWGIDLAGPFKPSTDGYTWIFTAIDVFSKYMILLPLKDKTAVTVSRAIYDHVFLKYGAGEILTDNGTEFKNQILNELCRIMNIQRAFTTSYQARTNAVCERSHGTVNSMLAKCVSEKQTDWPEHLGYVAFCYNASVHESTGFTPYFLVHGEEPRWDIDLQLGVEERKPYSVNDYADLLITRLEDAHELARQQLKTAATRMKDWYDKKVHVKRFEPGDEVYILNLRNYAGRCPKWVRSYSYRGTIVKRVNDVTYQVRCDKWRQKTQILHVDKLKMRKSLKEVEAEARPDPEDVCLEH